MYANIFEREKLQNTCHSPQLNSPQQLNFRLSVGISCFHPLYIRTYVRDKYACGNFGEIVAITIVIYSLRMEEDLFPEVQKYLGAIEVNLEQFLNNFPFLQVWNRSKDAYQKWTIWVNLIKRFRLTRILQGIIIFYSHINVNIAVEKFVNFDFKHFLNLEFNFSFLLRNLTSRRNKFGQISISIVVTFVDLFISPSV